MTEYVINGGKPLNGQVWVSGAKNAAVAILPAALLIKGKCRIENIPKINDVTLMLEILKYLGADIKLVDSTTIDIDCTNVRNLKPPEDLMRRMRASYYLMGALLGRFGCAEVSMPGGCDFGVRPIDQHLKGFNALNAEYVIKNGFVSLKSDGIKGAHIYMDKVSVGATINIVLAAAMADGLTIIENAAKEPHIVDLANFLNSMGADIKGAGTDVIKIRGVNYLRGGTYAIIPDQIEAGTYMTAVAAAGGSVLIKNVIPKHLDCISAKLIEMGVEIEEFDDSILVTQNNPLKKTNVKTMPYPGFPTDMQPQMAVVLCMAQGTSVVTESVWDNRFRYVDELVRMGATIQVDGKIAVILGKGGLTGASVKACDLRAGAAMVVAGMAAKGTTTISDISHIERGYECMVEKLTKLGADIKRISPAQNIGGVSAG